MDAPNQRCNRKNQVNPRKAVGIQARRTGPALNICPPTQPSPSPPCDNLPRSRTTPHATGAFGSKCENVDRADCIADEGGAGGSPISVQGLDFGAIQQEHLADLLVAVFSRLAQRRVPGGWSGSAFAAAPHQSRIVAGKIRMITSCSQLNEDCVTTAVSILQILKHQNLIINILIHSIYCR
jgi:hypothetical protein